MPQVTVFDAETNGSDATAAWWWYTKGGVVSKEQDKKIVQTQLPTVVHGEIFNFTLTQIM